MRVLFETAPIGNVVLRKPDGAVSWGWAKFVARVFEPGETVPPGHDAFPVSEWRRTTFAPDGSLCTPPPSFMKARIGKIPDAVIPRELLDTLSDDQLLAIEWALTGG